MMHTKPQQRGRNPNPQNPSNPSHPSATQTHRLAHRSTSNHSRQQHSYQRSKGKLKNWDFNIVRIVGKGTFGVVYYATLQSTGEDVAIKKVIQDENYKNRELEIIKDLDHPNVVRMLHYYFTREAKEVEAEGNREDVYLHLFMEYVPEDLFKMIRFFHKSDRQSFPSILIKAYSYQILRGLAYLKDCGICHRDIKPRNLLINPKTHQLKICDFGSAKKLVKGQSNLAYVCSRYYRAPELAFGNTNYSCKSDVWSAACVIAEMFLGVPLFQSESAVDHVATVFSILGTPTQAELHALNPSIKQDLKLQQLPAKKWTKILPKADPLLINLLARLLVYDPEKRMEPFEALRHQYFHELKGCKINGQTLSFLFEFSEFQKLLHKQDVRIILAKQSLDI